MSKKAWAIIALLFIGVFGYFIVSGDNTKDTPSGNNDVSNPKEVASDDHVKGAADKKVVLIEYLDFQCPACRSLFPVMQQAREKYADKVTFVVRHFPLTSIHSNALASSRAAEAAASQNKFFEMEELLFTTQDSWASLSTAEAQKTFEGFANQLGLDMDKFRRDYASSATLERINRDRGTGDKLGAQSTPTVILNGEKVQLNAAEDLDKALEAATKATTSGDTQKENQQ